MNLPHVSMEPLDSASRLDRLGSARGEFLQSMIGDVPVYHLGKTGTKVDVGHWFGKGAVWISILENEMILFAAGRKPFAERIAFDELNESRYNHVTGEVVLAPTETIALGTLKLPPLAALEVLAYIYCGENQDGLT